MSTQHNNNQYSKISHHKEYRVINSGITNGFHYIEVEVYNSKPIRYWVGEKVYNCINEHFKYIKDNIKYLYNGRLGKVYDIYLITGRELTITKGNYAGNKMIEQTLLIRSPRFNFRIYINTSYKIPYYRPVTFFNILIVNKNFILGYSAYTSDYIKLNRYRDYIMNHIDKDVVRRIEEANDSETLNIYTNILNDNSEKCGLNIFCGILSLVPMDDKAFDFTKFGIINELDKNKGKH